MDMFEKIAELYRKYDGNEYMINRLNTHITTILPNALELEYENYKDRLSRTNTLQTTQEMFIKLFLDKHKYYYVSASGFYYEYVDDAYVIRKEDDIHYKLLSTISEDRTLMDWKYKTKFNIIRQIKDRHLLASTPNTATVQRVLNAIYPAFFPSKNAAKYFLTIIGDNILKKQPPVRILHKCATVFSEIDRIAPLIGATYLTYNLTSKYNDNHTYSHYRLLQLNDHFSANLFATVVSQLNLDLLCVASHYSNRYGSSDQFIECTSDAGLRLHSTYLQTHPQDVIISHFIEHSTQPADESFRISWKQLHYIWKQYLNFEIIPNMMYSNSLKQMLKQRLQYDETSDTFINLTSKYLPNISHFLQFFASSIIPSETDELELGELHTLYPAQIKESDLLKLVSHFFPEVVVEDTYNKYILRVKCDLWNKRDEIITVLESCKQRMDGVISIDELYAEYTSGLVKGKLVASKHYFEKIARDDLKECMVYDTFFNMNYLNK